jgi:hypothetical protein
MDMDMDMATDKRTSKAGQVKLHECASPVVVDYWTATPVMMKRTIDFLLSFIVILVMSPVIVTLIIMVWVKIGSPVFFRQKRPGKDSKPFYILKFRTMSDLVDANGVLLPDADRLSKFGAFLRSTSLDELPALWNVLVGHMSLVGPRPLLMQYLPRYTAEQLRRHEVRPGITGWAQVNGRNAISWDEKFALDVWYVDNQSLLLDAKIVFMTIAAVLVRKDITAVGEATMPEFMGTHTST